MAYLTLMRLYLPHMRRKDSGFTLIELLVVISIIGLLASIVLASLTSARSKAKDASLKTEAMQLRNLMEQNANDYGRYTELEPQQWITASNVTCSTWGVSGTYAAQAQQICSNIATLQGGLGVNGGYQLFVGNNGVTNTAFDPQKYSIMVWLPGQNVHWCVGSDGVGVSVLGNWLSQGCYGNP